MKFIKSSETMNPCSVSAIYKWHQRFRDGRKSTADDSRDGPPCVVKMTMKDMFLFVFFAHLAKNVNQTGCLEVTEFKF